MALTEQEVELIKSSWKTAENEPRRNAILLFKMLFTKFPEYPKLFSEFSDVDVDNIEEDRRVARHALKVLNAISTVVHLLGDPANMDTIVETLEQMARAHLRRQIGLDKFENLGHVLIEFICYVNNHDPSPATKAAVSSSSPSSTTESDPEPKPTPAPTTETPALHDSKTSSLIEPWSKLYTIILDIVKKECDSMGTAQLGTMHTRLVDLPTASSMDDDI